VRSTASTRPACVSWLATRRRTSPARRRYNCVILGPSQHRSDNIALIAHTSAFARDESRQLSAFAGIWTETRADRGTKSKPIPGPHLVWFPDDGAERGRCADPSRGDAGDPD
jgi:hypothetical protein